MKRSDSNVKRSGANVKSCDARSSSAKGKDLLKTTPTACWITSNAATPKGKPTKDKMHPARIILSFPERSSYVQRRLSSNNRQRSVYRQEM